MPFATAQEVEAVKSQTQRLAAALGAHPGMTSTPKNMTIVYLWEFVDRTFSMTDGLDVTKDNDEMRQLWMDIVGRNMMAKTMIQDTTGRTAMMTGRSPSPTDFGPAVNEAAEAIR